MKIYLNIQEIYIKIETLLENLSQSILDKKNILQTIIHKTTGGWEESHIPLLKQQTQLQNEVNKYDEYVKSFDFLKDMMEDEEFTDSIKNEMMSLYLQLEKYFLSMTFSDEDHSDCFIEIQSGAGGDDAEDLANLLMQMYIRWSERYKHKCFIIDLWTSDHGIKSALLKVESKNSYGLLKGESGVHRFVRNSPFNSANKRQTSFIAVYVYPCEEKEDIIIDEKDLEYSFYKASGAGGQHVNKTESAVRIKHLSTGIIVNCQNERSQIMNKNIALKFLKIKLLKAKTLAQQEQNNAIEKKSIGWGNQTRSYIMSPYKLVKDLRTGYETQNIDDFLNGILLQDCLYQSLIKSNNLKTKSQS